MGNCLLVKRVLVDANKDLGKLPRTRFLPGTIQCIAYKSATSARPRVYKPTGKDFRGNLAPNYRYQVRIYTSCAGVWQI